MPFKAQYVFPHERNVSACVLSFRLVCCSLGTRPRRAPSPRCQALMGKGNASFRGSAFSTARRPFISPAPEGQRPGFHPPIPGPLSGAGGGERGRAVRTTQCSAAAAAAPAAPPLHLLPSPRTGRWRPSPRRRARGSTPFPPPLTLAPSGTLEKVAPRGRTQVRRPNFSTPGGRETRGWSPQRALTRRCCPAASDARARRCPRALPEGARNAPPEPGRLSRSGPRPAAARPGQREGAEPRPRSGAELAAPAAGAAPLAPRLPAAAGSPPARLPAPASHGRARPPPRPTPAPGGNLKLPDRASSAGPLPTPAAACLGLAPPAPSPATGGGSEPGELEVAPWWRRPLAPDPTGLAWAPPERGVGCRLLKGDVPGPREP